VKGTASPYDGNLLYWSQRLKTHPLLHATKAKLLQKQQGKCRWCELLFQDGDLMEIDHLDQNHENQSMSNLMLLHRHCHDDRHARYGALTEQFERRTSKRKKLPVGASPGNEEQPSRAWDETEFQAEHQRILERLRKLADEGIPIK